MDSLERELMQRRQTLEKAIELSSKTLAEAPEGTLRVDASKGIVRYFHARKDKRGREYIPNDKISLAEDLANKEYAEQILIKGKKELKDLDAYIDSPNRNQADLVYSKMNDARRILVKPILLDEETFRQKWKTQQYEQSSRFPEHLQFKTRNGEMVRSKSEAFIANIYYELGIPYRYECALPLKNNVVCYPDFTILDVAHRRIMYHEHLGRLDKPDYLAEQMWKLKEYQKNGIFTGKNLILTAETGECPFDAEQFRINVREIFTT
jgi:hypothetical protein